MLELLSKRALFRFEIPIPYVAKAPRIDGNLRKWSRKHQSPSLALLDDEEPLADVYWAWNEDGFYIAFDVPHRRGAPRCDPKQWWKRDGMRLCIDTRDGRENRRGTRYCHFFYFLPTGGGKRGGEPIVGMHRMSRATESPPKPDLTQVKLAARIESRGYALEAAIPASCLHGWDPVEHPRIGVFWKVKDVQLGAEHLSANDDLGWNVDPSTWATGVLTR
ncbi:MAG: hypothetical protein D6744_02490 [Planctomycetota bacterium]|nr:MAG: hypothetical protein D6744_02490 [Planctomycetota bacterium]